MESATDLAKLPLYHRLREEFRRCISEQIWRPGQPIPAEADLAASFGVAIGTVRKAVDQLVAESLLQRHQGKGTFVSRPSFTSSMFRFFRLEDIDGVQKVPRARILQRAVVEAPAEVCARLRLKRRAKALKLDRLRLFDDRPVLAEEIWLPHDRFGALAQLPIEDFGDLLYPLYEARCAQVVASAQETLTVDVASAADQESLGLAPGAPIVAIDRLACDLAGTPIEWRHTRGRADRFRYRVDIR
jgi:GntR family transcriptional regulator